MTGNKRLHVTPFGTEYEITTDDRGLVYYAVVRRSMKGTMFTVGEAESPTLEGLREKVDRLLAQLS